MFHEPKVLDVHPEILHQFGVVHVVGVMVGDGVVAEGCHLLGRIGGQRFVYPKPSIFWYLLKETKQSVVSRMCQG